MGDGRVPATSKLIPHDDMTDYCKKLCVLPRPLRRSPESTHRVWMSSPAAITPGNLKCTSVSRLLSIFWQMV